MQIMKEPTLEGAISGLNKAVDQLNKVSETKRASSEKKAEKAEELLSQSKADSEEMERAKRVAEKINELLS